MEEKLKYVGEIEIHSPDDYALIISKLLKADFLIHRTDETYKIDLYFKE